MRIINNIVKRSWVMVSGILRVLRRINRREGMVRCFCAVSRKITVPLPHIASRWLNDALGHKSVYERQGNICNSEKLFLQKRKQTKYKDQLWLEMEICIIIRICKIHVKSISNIFVYCRLSLIKKFRDFSSMKRDWSRATTPYLQTR